MRTNYCWHPMTMTTTTMSMQYEQRVSPSESGDIRHVNLVRLRYIRKKQSRSPRKDLSLVRPTSVPCPCSCPSMRRTYVRSALVVRDPHDMTNEDRSSYPNPNRIPHVRGRLRQRIQRNNEEPERQRFEYDASNADVHGFPSSPQLHYNPNFKLKLKLKLKGELAKPRDRSKSIHHAHEPIMIHDTAWRKKMKSYEL